MDTSKKDSNITKIVEAGLCNGCGTCCSICTQNAISIEENKKPGILFAEVNEENCTNCKKCILVCPSTEILINNNLSKNKLIGNYNQLLYGYSLDGDLRYRASSGGIISTLLRYLIEKNIIDGFILVKPSKNTPFLNEPFISRDINDIYKYAGTRYFPIPVNIILKEIKLVEGKFAIIGTPCQVYGITKYEMIDTKIKDKIYIKIGLFCGGVPNLNAYKYYMFANNIKDKNLKSIYRGVGWPGSNVFEYENGKKILKSRRPKSFFEKVYHTLSFFPIFAQKKCLLCTDRFSSFADISVGDAWLDIFKDDEKGTSLIITRNEEIDGLLLKMKKEKYIYFDNISENQVINSQGIFSHFYNNFYTTYNFLIKNKSYQKIFLNVNLSKYKNNINYFWIIKLLLITFGMRISENKFGWRFLFIYGILFTYTNKCIDILLRFLKNKSKDLK